MEKISRNEALRQGLTRYYTGNECQHGHHAARLSSNGKCVECNKIIIKKKLKAKVARNRQNVIKGTSEVQSV